MSFARAFHRPWVFVTLPTLIVAGLVGVGGLQSLAIMPVDSSIRRFGEFAVEYDTYDAFGHRATRRSLYYSEGRRLRLVRKGIVEFTVNPHKLNSALYEYCPEEGHVDCGIHYFDGDTKLSRKVSTQRILGDTDDGPGPWSADARFVVLAEQFRIELVDLKNGEAKALSELLALMEGRRFVRFVSWSNDQRKFAVLVGEYMDKAPPYQHIAEDLIVIDVRDGSASYVATAQPNGWPSVLYYWQRSDDGYLMQAPADGVIDDLVVLRKPPSN